MISENTIAARAFENGIHVAYANSAGVENGLAYFGGSCIVGPNGRDLARAGDTPCMLNAVIDAEAVTAAQTTLPYLTARKALPWA